MGKNLIVCIAILFIHSLHAQDIKTILPQKNIHAGTAFLVQYIIKGPEDLVSISKPEFDNLKVIRGPEYHKGHLMSDGRVQPVRNIVYTLVSENHGNITIKGINAVWKNGREIKSSDETINIEPAIRTSFMASSSYTDSDLYFTRSSTDLEGMIGGNLFVKTELNKKTCYVGEAVTVTFTLFSRMQTNSEVSNSPGLYGFSAVDMIDIYKGKKEVKILNNKVFNTSILRKLQLFPERSGRLTIEGMQVKNEIEYEDDTYPGLRKTLEKHLASDPVELIVRAIPEESPSDFNGAVGTYSIESRLEKNKIASNQQGKLIISIKGKGNFIQMTAPAIQWPKGFDVFDHVISDKLNKSALPLEGEREYVFRFVNSTPGEYIVPPVTFSFFDPLSASFKTLQSDSLFLKVEKANESALLTWDEIPPRKKNWIMALAVAAVLLLAGILIWLYNIRKLKPKPVLQVVMKPDHLEQLVVLDLSNLSDKEACIELQKISRKVFTGQQLTPEHQREFDSIENDCRLLAYADIGDAYKKEELKLRLIRLLQEMEKSGKQDSRI